VTNRSPSRPSALVALAALAQLACGCQWSSAPPPADNGAVVVPLASDDAGAIGSEDAGPTTTSVDPVDAALLDAGPASGFAAGGQHTCAVTGAGGVWCWGSNVQQQLGTTVAGGSLVAVQVVSVGSHATAVTAGDEHSCALSVANGASTVQCWGADGHGQLGVAGLFTTPAPVTVHGLASAVSAIAAGGFHTCALAGGAVACWGDDADGQLGNGASADSATPVAVQGLSGVKAIAAGGAHTCALTSAGGVECWGYNAYGQVGDGTTTSRSTPVPVSGLGSGVVAISAGNAHTCALTSGGAVECWGFGLYGQLGNGAIASSATPVAVSGLSGVTAVAAGGTHTCALVSGGAVWCWGDDQSGQLGNNDETDSALPVAVQGIAQGVTSLVGGTAHACAIVTGGAAQCWGWNVAGELGDDTGVDSTTPVSVLGF
jgi:alpha-tubulin suppressor-like RCC1 family protein